MSLSQTGKTYALFQAPVNKKIINELEKNGANIILLPPLKAEETEINAETEHLLRNLSDFDWIIFSNIFTVDYFLQALEKLEVDFFELDALRICAFGETVADRLRYAQIHADVISNTANTEEAFQALAAYEPDLQSFRFLIPVEKNMEPQIIKLLLEVGTEIENVSLYRTINSDSLQLPRLKALIKGGAIDEFIFNSTDEPTQLVTLFPSENLLELLSDTAISVTNPTIYQALREFGVTKITMR